MKKTRTEEVTEYYCDKCRNYIFTDDIESRTCTICGRMLCNCTELSLDFDDLIMDNIHYGEGYSQVICEECLSIFNKYFKERSDELIKQRRELYKDFINEAKKI